MIKYKDGTPAKALDWVRHAGIAPATADGTVGLVIGLGAGKDGERPTDVRVATLQALPTNTSGQLVQAAAYCDNLNNPDAPGLLLQPVLVCGMAAEYELVSRPV